ncbi:hypothetical protein BDQ17DRAFT_394464 [Cyathus striatus]|nr:hypothetical protein BDQ17DRAFT_394464 [Cyathus striatus]
MKSENIKRQTRKKECLTPHSPHLPRRCPPKAHQERKASETQSKDERKREIRKETHHISHPPLLKVHNHNLPIRFPLFRLNLRTLQTPHTTFAQHRMHHRPPHH